jgi:molybdopterin-guanine dinucleotide biosynthesis protein A
MPPVVAGIFVGGASVRMGGRPKGLMPGPGGSSLVDRLRKVLSEAGVLDVVLVGCHPAYGPLGLRALDDRPSSIGPLGGLVSLLRHASDSGARALALACDMPFVPLSLVKRLSLRSDAPVVAPRRNDLWEPLCASYAAEQVLPMALRQATGTDHSLQKLLREAGAVELALEPDEARALTDWDAPEDIT